jgi:hypothetical protein
MLGHYAVDHNQEEYLFLVKGNEIKDHFKLHTKTLAIKKVSLKEAKLIVSLGYDSVPQVDEDGMTEIPEGDVMSTFELILSFSKGSRGWVLV